MKKQKVHKKSNNEKHICYVCNNIIRQNPVYVCGEKFRHHRCQPGGARWLESDRAKESEMTQYFGGTIS